MTGIPYNYGKYIDDTVKLRDQGTVDAGKQIKSPASAGSRGLAKTTQFTNDRTQMQLGQEAIAESMADIRNILNRIDGVNVPVQEAPKQKAMSVDKIYDMVQNLEHVIQQHPDFKDYDKSIIMASLGQLKDDIAAGDLKETSVKEDDGDERAIAAMKLAKDENRKEGFDYPQGGKYGYKAERGSGTGAMGTMQVNVTIHDRETDETMYIKDMNYLELEKGDEQETLAMIWDENRDLIQKESAVQEDSNRDDLEKAYMLAVRHHEGPGEDEGSGDGNYAEDTTGLLMDYYAKTGQKPDHEQIERISNKIDDNKIHYADVLQAEGINGKIWLELAKKHYGGLMGIKIKEPITYPESAVQEDLDSRSEDILNKAGFDPADIDTYMKVFNDHGDTSDIDQMNMKEKVGLADVMSMVLASHGIQNESYQPFPEGDEFNIEDDEDFEEVLGPLGFPEDETELFDAEYRGRKVPLNKPMRGDVKKFKVYVKDPKTGNVKKVNFGHGGTSAKRKTMRIRKSNPKARKSFRARHNCANPGPKTKARYWSCRKW